MPARECRIVNPSRPLTLDLPAIVAQPGLGGRAGLSTQGRNAVVGAGVGAVGGALPTDGSPRGTIGGAVLGDVVGRELDTSQ
jgi:osmotically inducible lipoprotein OsmB